MLTKNIIELYHSGMVINDIAATLKVGTKKVRNILHNNGIDTSKKNKVKQHNYIVPDYHIEKYPCVNGYTYLAIDRNNGFETSDYNNKAGILTSHISKTYNIKIPTLYERRKYYMKTGDYWWEQWFDIVKKEQPKVKKCPYCNWETIDTENRSGAFEIHLKKAHNKSKIEYLKETSFVIQVV